MNKYYLLMSIALGFTFIGMLYIIMLNHENSSIITPIIIGIASFVLMILNIVKFIKER